MFQPRRMRGPISARDPSDSAAAAFAAFVAESSYASPGCCGASTRSHSA
jgi:hypothetical protein